MAVPRETRPVRVYAVIATAAYVVAEGEAWWPRSLFPAFCIPGVLRGRRGRRGALLAGCSANDAVNTVGYRPRIAAMLVTPAVAAAAATVVFT